MEDDEEIHQENLPMEDNDFSLPDVVAEDQDHEDGEAAEEEAVEEGESMKPTSHTSHEPKLRELLRNLCSFEVKIYSEASKDFVRLLRGDLGGEVLYQYIQASSKCTELLEAWKLRQGKPGMTYVLLLISEVLGHPFGKSRTSGIRRSLDNFARLIIGTKLEDIYVELNSQESKRQSAALSLLASIVRRGMGFASEVAKNFEFKLPILPNLSGIQKNTRGKETKHHVRHLTRRSFVEFAMSFLEVGNPRLLRWILQQKDMYSGVLRGIGSDDVETVIYVLSTLRDKVLTSVSLVPPGLRSVLFGSVTLEQLSYISGNPVGGPAADMAHEVLVMVCTDPSNGLMPESNLNLKGNLKRLLDLMKKLKATEIGYHKDLLLAVVKGRPFLCSAYMDEFPYHLEPRASPPWFAAISLAADLISAASSRPSFTLIAASQSCDPPNLDSMELQCILKCIVPHSFTRSVINKGLLHSDILVKHGSLRLLLEALKSLDSLIGAIDDVVENMSMEQDMHTFGNGLAELNGVLGFGSFANVDRYLDPKRMGITCTDKPRSKKWMSLKQDIQDVIRAVLPDSQVLLKLLSSMSYNSSKSSGLSLKRGAHLPKAGLKKLKSDSYITDENVDIVISGLDSEIGNLPENSEKGEGIKEMDMVEDCETRLADIWGLHELNMITDELKEVEIFFHAKLLDVLTLYLRTMPIALEGSYDFFKILPCNPLSSSINQQRSVLSLLAEYIGQSTRNMTSIRAPEFMYKHLQPLVNLLIYSPVKDIKDQAYVLARAAMLSTGAFDQNLSEIDSWFLFLPGYNRDKYTVEIQGAEVFGNLSSVVISFLCDAVSTMGNNLFKYLDLVRVLTSKLEGLQDNSPDFSPLVICILHKCLRLLESDSGTFKLSERSMVSLYVCNTLSFLLQTQVDMGVLSGLIDLVLTEKSVDEASKCSLCEWRPLKNLLFFARGILHQQNYRVIPVSERTMKGNDSTFFTVLGKVKELLGHAQCGGLVCAAVAFSSSIICASPNDILESFPSLVIFSQHLLKEHISFLSSVLFLEQTFLASVANLWPDMFFSGLDIAGSTKSNTCRYNDAHFQNCNGSSTSKTGRLIFSKDLDSTQSAAVAFSYLLKHVPFYVLFSASMNFESCNLLASTKILDLLQARLAEVSIDDSVLSLCILLFWAYQVRVSYKIKSSDDLEQLSHMCFTLIGDILERLLVVTSDSTKSESTDTPILLNRVREVAEIIFHHPIVTGFLSHPLHCSGTVAQILGHNLEGFLTSSRQTVHPMDHQILHLLDKVAGSLLALRNGGNCVSKTHGAVPESVVRAFKCLVQQSVLLFKENFNQCIMTKDLVPLLPSFYIFHSLMRFISPFELLELVHWTFCKVDNELAGWISPKVSTLSVCLYIADGVLDMLCSFLHQQDMNEISHLFWEMRGRSVGTSLVQDIYSKILQSAISFKLESADLCLLKAVNAVYSQRFMLPHTARLPLSMVMSRMIISSPMKILTHCIYSTSKTKARLLFELTEVSPLHLSLFGMTFLGIINKDLSDVDVLNVDGAYSLKDEMTDRSNYVFSNEDFMLLLPTALSYLTSNLIKFRNQDPKLSSSIPSLYSRILLDGFSDWKSFVSGDIFYEEYEEFTPASMEELQGVFSCTLLGKAVHMLRCFFIFSESSAKRKQRLDKFYSIYTCTCLHDELLDCDIREINPHSYNESANLINKVIAKISVTRLLLFPPENLIQPFQTEGEEVSNEMSIRMESNRENCAKLRFLNIMINTYDKIVRKFPLSMEDWKKMNSADCSYLFNFLEAFILRNIVQLSMEIQSYLNQLPSIPFLEPFVRSSFLHRFDDPATLKAIRSILITLEGKFSSAEVLGLLLGHSEFISTILESDSFSDSSGSTPTGTLLQPMPSIFKVLDNPFAIHNSQDGNDSYKQTFNHSTLGQRKLELIKLLRVLYHFKDQQHDVYTGNIVGMNARELLSLLLSGYGATLSEIDLEILHLMHEIESSDGSDGVSIAEMDYLWGGSVLKIRKEQTLDRLMPPRNISDCETTEEQCRRLFRENIPVDSKLCAMTVLHFCFNRATLTAPLSLQKLLQDDFRNSPKQALSTNMDRIQRYDPAFILQFSIHSLLRGYIEPVEFARLGLLAVAFVSISSPDNDIRKLGYEALGSFKKAFENHRNSKDTLQLQLLLTYLQNGISEPWQRIPSVTAIFAAEASFVVLDPSQNHFQTITKLLMRTPRVDLKSIPLFHTLFGSGSIHFKTDRLWILQLLYAGLNLDDDAQIFMRKFLFELLMSFYASSLSDYGTKNIILQIVKKSVKLHVLARSLVEDCGLIPWLYSILSFCGERLCADHKDISLKRMEMVLEVISDLISLKVITKWLQEHALEQISELSSYLHKLLVCSLHILKENVLLINSILHVLRLTLKISQKRMIYKPHFTLSLEGLFQLYQAIYGELRNLRFSLTIEQALNTILMSTPPSLIYQTDKAKLSKLVVWAISATLQSSTKRYLIRDPDPDLLNSLEEQESKESLISKILRWVTASVILGSISSNSSKIDASFAFKSTKIETLQSLLEDIAKEQPESTDNTSSTNEALAVIILYLQQLLGMKCRVLPSVVSALCLLRLSYASNSTESGSLDHSNLVASLSSKIRCPAEANPAWRWSFYQPWKDLSLEHTFIQEVEEQQACQTLLIIFSNSLSGKSLGLPVLLHQDLEESGFFAWERSTIIGSGKKGLIIK